MTTEGMITSGLLGLIAILMPALGAVFLRWLDSRFERLKDSIEHTRKVQAETAADIKAELESHSERLDQLETARLGRYNGA